MTSAEQYIATAKREVDQARARVRNEMRDAASGGLSLRRIAAAAGVSYETVRRIVGTPRED